MACGCSGSRGARSGKVKANGAPLPGHTLAYKVTLPPDKDGQVAVKRYLTALEAKAQVRRARGGTIKTIHVDAKGNEVIPDSPDVATVAPS